MQKTNAKLQRQDVLYHVCPWIKGGFSYDITNSIKCMIGYVKIGIHL